MNLEELRQEVTFIINEIKDKGDFRKENNLIDYKKALNHFNLTDEIDIFFRNFAKDILAFTNHQGGIILLGFEENKETGEVRDIGLEIKDSTLLNKIDTNYINQRVRKITGSTIHIEIQAFKISSRKCYYILVEKSNQILIPINDFTDCRLKKGQIIHRLSGSNEVANENAQTINQFIQIKANEKNKEFMEIWSKLLPEIFDINPKEILMINPKSNKIYGYNQKDNRLDSSEIEIDKDELGTFNIILNTISAGEIGKISDTEGKPIYKIVGEITSQIEKPPISMTTLRKSIQQVIRFNINDIQIKQAINSLNWTNSGQFSINNPNPNLLNEKYNEYPTLNLK